MLMRYVLPQVLSLSLVPSHHMLGLLTNLTYIGQSDTAASLKPTENCHDTAGQHVRPRQALRFFWSA
jgi:hypothetical protein